MITPTHVGKPYSLTAESSEHFISLSQKVLVSKQAWFLLVPTEFPIVLVSLFMGMPTS
jgi:hypothetical protein